jgi:RNA polymerase sigma-70 factor (ECF subfamily)
MNTLEEPAPTDPVARQLVAARQGSREALGQLLERCRKYLLLVANRELDPDLLAKVGPSDLVQETFLEAQQDFGRFDGGSETELLAWLRCILLNNLASVTRHYCQTDMRLLAREIPMGDPEASELRNGLEDEASSPSSHIGAQEEDAQLQRALGQLPLQYRQVVGWRNYDRLSFPEIGARLGCSPAAARKLWGRAIEYLQELIGPCDET